MIHDYLRPIHNCRVVEVCTQNGLPCVVLDNGMAIIGSMELLNKNGNSTSSGGAGLTEANDIATVISRGALYAHANTRPHAVAAAHAALAILTEGGHPDKVGAALVKEMSKWLESTRKATLEQAAQTVSALR